MKISLSLLAVIGILSEIAVGQYAGQHPNSEDNQANEGLYRKRIKHDPAANNIFLIKYLKKLEKLNTTEAVQKKSPFSSKNSIEDVFKLLGAEAKLPQYNNTMNSGSQMRKSDDPKTVLDEKLPCNSTFSLCKLSKFAHYQVIKILKAADAMRNYLNETTTYPIK